TFPTWLRMIKKGQMVTAQFSEDPNGASFKALGPAHDMGGPVPGFAYAGVAVTARKDGQYVIGKVDLNTLKIEPAPSPETVQRAPPAGRRPAQRVVARPWCAISQNRNGPGPVVLSALDYQDLPIPCDVRQVLDQAAGPAHGDPICLRRAPQPEKRLQ